VDDVVHHQCVVVGVCFCNKTDEIIVFFPGQNWRSSARRFPPEKCRACRLRDFSHMPCASRHQMLAFTV
jgi:hypothetical protein